MQQSIAGLMPGVELVRLGQCGAEEFEQVGDDLLKGPRGNSQIVVKPAVGYEFRFEIASNSYRPVRVLPAKRTFVIHLEASTQQDVAHIEAIKRLPSVVKFEETTAPDVAAAAPPIEQVNA